MNKNWLILAASLMVVGCTDKGDTGATDSGDADTTDTTDTDGGTDSGTAPATTVECTWDGTGLDVTIVNGDSSGYNLGLAEVAAEGWTGEDCYLGYTAGDGTTYEYCHPASASGVFLTTVGDFSKVVEGSTTIHSGAINNTYFLEEVSSGLCWVWGDSASYYGDLGCSDISSSLTCTGD